MILRTLIIISTFLITGCFSLKEDESKHTYLGYKNIQLKGVVNVDDYRLTPQKPPGLDNTITIQF
jgi:hypothetical protein